MLVFAEARRLEALALANCWVKAKNAAEKAKEVCFLSCSHFPNRIKDYDLYKDCEGYEQRVYCVHSHDVSQQLISYTSSICCGALK